MDQPKANTVVCECCELKWPQRLASAVRDGHLLIRGWRCRMCSEHQGDTLKMAQDHENEIRVRWGDTADELRTALAAAEHYKARMLAAFSSRDRILEQFEKLGRYHRPTDHGCICGERNCKELSIIAADWINDRIAKRYQRGVS
jgi:hypothetical protein